MADIIENAERIERYLQSVGRSAFAANGMLRDAVERCMERVCEAAVRLGASAGEVMPGQPWGAIRGMGNQLRHAYDRGSLDVVWKTARDELPGLLIDARRALAEPQAKSDQAR